jgi:hypothetical protein
MAFPTRLRSDAAAVADVMPATTSGFRQAFTVTTEGEPVTIPERIYHPEPKSFEALTETQQLMLHCVYTRHHDGFVRQRHLQAILASGEDWVAPFVVRLVGEYVLPIVEDIHAALVTGRGEHENLSRFAAENPSFVDLTGQRAVSYWDAYHRQEYPHRDDYPGIVALREI